jgi:hypothetical protein
VAGILEESRVGRGLSLLGGSKKMSVGLTEVEEKWAVNSESLRLLSTL